MGTTVIADRAHFAFLIMFHYLFPILTMGLSVLIAVLKTFQLVTKEERYANAARFWGRIFALNFAAGVATGIPMEFQFGTNWAQFSNYSGGIIGQGLMMEGVYAFFLESVFLGLFLFGEKRVPLVVHWLSSVLVACGTLLSGYFITMTDAFMQHPVGYRVGTDGVLHLTSLWAVMSNPYELWEYTHTINGALVTGAMVMTALGAYYMLANKHLDFARISLRIGVIAGLIFSFTQLFPTGDKNGENVVKYNPEKLAAMEGLFQGEKGAPLAIIGMPDTEHGQLIDPIYVPDILSYLTYGNFHASVKGLNDYPRDLWPPMEVTYYAYHIMVGLGTVFIGEMAIAAFLLWRGGLFRSRWFLWILMLSVPFPYIANEAGWVVTEVGRQPWLIVGLMRTAQGYSTNVPAGEVIFTLLGFAGLYAALGLVFLFLVLRMIAQGPEDATSQPHAAQEKAA
jgi:cytochrome d ubiquinol oxidase subunit I